MERFGLVGLPNAGKSSLYNALTGGGALAAPYPFATKDPNIGVAKVPDERVERLGAMSKTKVLVHASVEVVDIGGLVEGASKGEGLGNKFLANIREVDAIVHVIRCFEDDDVQHVMGGPDPVRDRTVINTELALSDMVSLEKRLDRATRAAKTGDATAKAEKGLMERVMAVLENGGLARAVEHSAEEEPLFKSLNLLTSKPVLYAANVREDELADGNAHVEALRAAIVADGEQADVVIFSAKVEAELAELPAEDRADFMASLGVHESGLDRLARAAYHLLNLQSYFTAGEKEVRAWTIRVGAKAPEAAGVIHSDFEKGFIRAETVAYADFVRVGGWKPSREQGLARAEGKEYVVQDGDLMLFRFNT